MPNQVLDVKIFKNLNGGGSRGEWSNSYQLETEFATDSPEVAAQVIKLAQMERSFHLTIVTFTRAIVSTYKKEVGPAELDDSTEVPLAFNGTVSENIDEDGEYRQLPGEVVLVVKRKSKGRTSRVTYRHAIAHNEWTGGGNGVTLSAAKIAQVSSALGGYMGFDNQPIPLVKANKASALGVPGYRVTSMTVVGTANRQLDARRNKKKEKADPNADSPEKRGEEANASMLDYIKSIFTAVGNAVVTPDDLVKLAGSTYGLVVRAIQAYNEVRRASALPAIPIPEPPMLPPAP